MEAGKLRALIQAARNKDKRRLYAILGVQLIKGVISYNEFRKLSEWLGCYHYVLPAERELLPSLANRIHGCSSPRNASEFFIMYLAADTMLCAYSKVEQEAVIQELIANEGAINV